VTLRLSDGREFSFDAESMAKLVMDKYEPQKSIPEGSSFNNEDRQVTHDIID
jgi:hypothetical protein